MATAKNTKISASNVELMNVVRSLASAEYRERVPEVTRATIAKTAKMIHDYQPLWNEFYTTLFDRIGLVVFNNNQFSNRLAPFKKSMNYGAMVQESSANLIQAESYNEEKNVDPFAAQKPDLVTDYHSFFTRPWQLRVSCPPISTASIVCPTSPLNGTST